ncbi:MAG: DUF4332 domain-containing protein [Thiotrichales bacterium]
MTYLITQIIVFLLLAAAFGFFWGWLVRGLACSHQQKAQRQDAKLLTEQVRSLEKENSALTHKIDWLEASNTDLNARLIDISSADNESADQSPSSQTGLEESIPADTELDLASLPGIKQHLSALDKHHLHSIKDLLEYGNTLRGRAELALDIGVNEETIRRWASCADLMRISYIDAITAEHLLEAGVHSVLALRAEEARELTAKLNHLMAEKDKATVEIEAVSNWIEQAKTLDSMSGIAPPATTDDEFLIDSIEGIGPAYRKRLAGEHVYTTLDLLQRGASAEGRASIAKTLTLRPEVIQRWVSMADLMRIPGVSGREARLLYTAGYQCVAALNHLSVEDLKNQLQKACSDSPHLGMPPDDETLKAWIRDSNSIHDVL